jgi:hypothetical protein
MQTFYFWNKSTTSLHIAFSFIAGVIRVRLRASHCIHIYFKCFKCLSTIVYLLLNTLLWLSPVICVYMFLMLNYLSGPTINPAWLEYIMIFNITRFGTVTIYLGFCELKCKRDKLLTFLSCSPIAWLVSFVSMEHSLCFLFSGKVCTHCNN